jgi:hypothetical protein
MSASTEFVLRSLNDSVHQRKTGGTLLRRSTIRAGVALCRWAPNETSENVRGRQFGDWRCYILRPVLTLHESAWNCRWDVA